MTFSLIFSKRLSSFFCLLFISFFALVMGTIIIVKANNLAELQKPAPFYIQELVEAHNKNP